MTDAELYAAEQAATERDLERDPDEPQPADMG